MLKITAKEAFDNAKTLRAYFEAIFEGMEKSVLKAKLQDAWETEAEGDPVLLAAWETAWEECNSVALVFGVVN